MENKGVFTTIIIGILALITAILIILCSCASASSTDIVNNFETTIPTEAAFCTEPVQETGVIENTEVTVLESQPTEPVGPIKLSITELEPLWQSDAEFLAKVVHGEAGCCSMLEREKVIWCVLNRVDDLRFPNSIEKVVTQYNQFHGYNFYHPVIEENYILALEVISKWLYEKEGGIISRPLDSDYLFFYADSSGFKNIYTKNWR